MYEWLPKKPKNPLNNAFSKTEVSIVIYYEILYPLKDDKVIKTRKHKSNYFILKND